MTCHLGGARDALVLHADDARSVVLDDRSDGRHRQLVIAGNVGCHGVLEAHTKLGVACGHERIGTVLGGLHDLDLEARLFVVAALRGNVHARVVRVGRPVQGKGHLAKAGALSRRGTGSLGATTAAPRKRQNAGSA